MPRSACSASCWTNLPSCGCLWLRSVYSALGDTFRGFSSTPGNLLVIVEFNFCTRNFKCKFRRILWVCIRKNNLQVTFFSVQDKRVYRLGVRNTTILMLAIVCWINDRMFCDAWSRVNFPYLHGFWHILIFISAYTACVLFAYFFVSDERPESRPQLKYWPHNAFELGVPYVSISCYKKLNDDI
uniref:Alkaline ceramidase n=1 Tax=Culex pipiens TaxID=7175 RepID=A0A8D8JBM8_CULPI